MPLYSRICIILVALAIAGAAGCSAGFSSRCGYDWNGTEVCEARFHHFGKPATFSTYAYRKDELIPLYSEESSSITAPLTALAGVAP